MACRKSGKIMGGMIVEIFWNYLQDIIIGQPFNPADIVASLC